jgi:hypothetical protein
MRQLGNLCAPNSLLLFLRECPIGIRRRYAAQTQCMLPKGEVVDSPAPSLRPLAGKDTHYSTMRCGFRTSIAIGVRILCQN